MLVSDIRTPWKREVLIAKVKICALRFAVAVPVPFRHWMLSEVNYVTIITTINGMFYRVFLIFLFTGVGQIC